MALSYIIYKQVKQDGKRINLYLSVTGKWVKSTATATVKCHDQAEILAKELGCSFRAIFYKN
jgi:hypothetical protein